MAMVTFTPNTKIVSADVNANFSGLADASLIPSNTITPAKIKAEAWTLFTPTWTAVTLGNGSTVSYYQQIGSWVIYRGILACGSTTNTTGIASPIFCTLPVTAKATSPTIDVGPGRISNSSGGISTNVSAVILSATQLYFYSDSATQAVAGDYPTGYLVNGVGNSTGDTIAWTIVYEAA